MDTLGMEPKAFRMRSGCATITPCAHLLRDNANENHLVWGVVCGGICTLEFCVSKGKVTAVGFESTPLRDGALSLRLRPLGQTVMEFC